MAMKRPEITPGFLNNAIAGLAAANNPDDAILKHLTGFKVTPGDLLKVILAHQRGMFRSDVKNPDAYTAAAAAREVMDLVSPPEADGMLQDAAVAPPAGFAPTAEHTAIFAAVDAGQSLTIRALAGSGKTTTMVKAVERILSARPAASVLCLAFNKSIAEAMRTRLPKDVVSSTIHSLCWQAVRKNRGWGRGEDRIRDQRSTDAAAAALATCQEQIADRMVAVKELRNLWSLARATMTDPGNPQAVASMAARYGAQITSGSALLSLVAAVDARLASDRDSISYDEMLTAVIDDGLGLDSYDVVVIDEAQDLNALQIAILGRCKPKQVIAVGDPNQAIYGWRGADVRAMDTLSQAFQVACALPLSVTYRCAQTIVAEANRLVPTLKAREGAPVGSVLVRRADQLDSTLASLKPGDLVLCRTNAPLLPAMFATKRRTHQPAAILGLEQEGMISGLIAPVCQGDRNLSAFEASRRLREQLEGRINQLQSSGQVGAAQALQDQLDMALALLSEHRTAADAIASAHGLFTSSVSKDRITFASIHKSKGLEADRVVILESNRIPHPRVLASGCAPLITQEDNLLYVAITRARQILILQEAA